MFMFSFYCGGLRIGDVLELGWANLRNGRLVYGIEKTDKDRSVLLLPQAITFIKQFEEHRESFNDFIFPMLIPRRITASYAFWTRRRRPRRHL